MKSSWLYILLFIKCYMCSSQIGPDPWDYEKSELSQSLSSEIGVPSDLRTVPMKKIHTENSPGQGEWFYKRLLAIVLKGGKVQINEDETIDISLQMKFDHERWSVLNEYINTNKHFTENMFRRSVGYIEDSIQKPSIMENIVIAWSEYIQFYLTEYKVQITWIFTVITIKVGLIWLWQYISHKHILILSFSFLYLYEVFISYKEAEKQQIEIFLSAVNTCKWYIWSSQCEVPPPDPLIFLKHMNPLKIGIRIFTVLISEPMIIISDTINTIIHGITDGLWFPLDKIMYGILIVTLNVLLIFLLIMIIFNYILNIPFKLSFLGLINVGLKQRNRNISNTDNIQTARLENNDRISGATLDKILDVCSRALSTAEVTRNGNNTLRLHAANSGLRRSASTGRLPNLGNDYIANNRLALEGSLGKSRIKPRGNGSGDA